MTAPFSSQLSWQSQTTTGATRSGLMPSIMSVVDRVHVEFSRVAGQERIVDVSSSLTRRQDSLSQTRTGHGDDRVAENVVLGSFLGHSVAQSDEAELGSAGSRKENNQLLIHCRSLPQSGRTCSCSGQSCRRFQPPTRS